jgi:hypothetical protein
VTAQLGAILIKRLKALNRKEAAFGENGVECAAGMALAQNESIAGGPTRVGAADAQDARVEHSEDIGA